MFKVILQICPVWDKQESKLMYNYGLSPNGEFFKDQI